MARKLTAQNRHESIHPLKKSEVEEEWRLQGRFQFQNFWHGDSGKGEDTVGRGESGRKGNRDSAEEDKGEQKKNQVQKKEQKQNREGRKEEEGEEVMEKQ